MTDRSRSMLENRIPSMVAVAAGVFMLAFGLWAFFDPQSFYDQIALFSPYNEHLLHDVGAFQVGLGAALLLRLVCMSHALLVALAGAGVGAVLDFIAHGDDTDPGGLGGDQFALVGVAAA